MMIQYKEEMKPVRERSTCLCNKCGVDLKTKSGLYSGVYLTAEGEDDSLQICGADLWFHLCDECYKALIDSFQFQPDYKC